MSSLQAKAERMTREGLVYVRPCLLIYCVLSYVLYSYSSVVAINYLFAVALMYTVLRYIVDVQGVAEVTCWWPLWMAADLALVSALVLLTGGISSWFVIVFYGIVVLYSLEHGMKVGLTSAAVASLCLMIITALTHWPLLSASTYQLIMSASFLLLLAWFTGSMSDDEKTLRMRLTALATTDPLTGLYNQRHLYDKLEQEIDHSDKANSKFSLLALDIDFFKAVNDRYGHPAGDRVLKQIANLMRSLVRNEDMIFRVGGEEFVVLLPGANTSDAAAIGERIRSGIADSQFKISRQQQLNQITISIGVATYPDQATSASNLLSWADQALYGAKARGKDQVRISTGKPDTMSV